MLRDLVPTEVLELSPAEIACCDIAELNLCAAHGLPGIECVDAGKLLNRLDDWSYQVRVDICQHLYRLDPRSKRPPTQFSHGNSLARFLCWHLLQVLQKDCGVAYHPERKFNPDFCHPEDLFIHGIVEADGKGGTCGSMPVVYVAVAKRLEFPVHLVETKGHLFFRWEDSKGTRLQWVHPKLNLWIPPDRFNVEGSGEGIAYYDDAFYVQWPELWNENDAAHGRYLKSLTNVDAFASFLVQRAECFYEAGQWQQCIQSIEMARKLTPDDPRYEWLHAKRLAEWQRWRQQIVVAECRRLEAPRQRDPLQTALKSHPETCTCAHCRETRREAEANQGPLHGDYCQCFSCQEARQKRANPVGIPGHNPFCECVMCLQRRTMPSESQSWTNPRWPSEFPS